MLIRQGCQSFNQLLHDLQQVGSTALKHQRVSQVVNVLGGTSEVDEFRDLSQFNDAKMIEFQQGGYREHLGYINSWVDEGLLTYGEPDILAVLRSGRWWYVTT